MSAWLDANVGWLLRAERWRARDAEPLRLRAWFTSPIAWDAYDGLTALEGALQWLVVLRETGRVPSDVFVGCDVSVDVPIPIADVQVADRTIACASWAVPPPIAIESVRWIRKRPRADAYALQKVLVRGGPFKSLNIPIATVTTPFIDWFVRGDRSLLKELLPDAAGIARLRSNGLGSICGWEIDSDPDDRSLWFCGAPQRAIPIAEEAPDYLAPGSFVVRDYPVRAPYWLHRHVTRCAIPNGPLGAPRWS